MDARRAVSFSGEIRTSRALPGDIRTRRSFSGDIWTPMGLSGDIWTPAGLFGRHFAIRGPLSVRKSPDNGCGVRKLPGGTGGTPRAYESRPATPAAPVHVQKPPVNADGMPGKCPKAACQCGAGAGVRFSPLRPRRPRLQPLADARQLFSYEHVENPR